MIILSRRDCIFLCVVPAGQLGGGVSIHCYQYTVPKGTKTALIGKIALVGQINERMGKAQKIKKALKQRLLYVLIISNQNYKILGVDSGSGD
jgi:hypothetical protein